MGKIFIMVTGAILLSAIAAVFIVWTVYAFIAWDAGWLADLGSFNGDERMGFLIFFFMLAVLISVNALNALSGKLS